MSQLLSISLENIISKEPRGDGVGGIEHGGDIE